MDFSYKVTEGDFRLVQALASQAYKRLMRRSIPQKISEAALWLGIFVLLMEIFHLYEKYRGDVDVTRDFSWLLLCEAATGIAVFVLVQIHLRRTAAFRKDSVGPFPVDQRLRVLEDGLEFQSEIATSHYPWRSIPRFETHNEHFVLALRPRMIVVVPFRIFSSPSERESFAATIRAHLNPAAT